MKIKLNGQSIIISETSIGSSKLEPQNKYERLGEFDVSINKERQNINIIAEGGRVLTLSLFTIS